MHLWSGLISYLIKQWCCILQCLLNCLTFKLSTNRSGSVLAHLLFSRREKIWLDCTLDAMKYYLCEMLFRGVILFYIAVAHHCLTEEGEHSTEKERWEWSGYRNTGLKGWGQGGNKELRCCSALMKYLAISNLGLFLFPLPQIQKPDY